MAISSPFSSPAVRRPSNRLAWRASHTANAVALLALGSVQAQTLTDITITETAPSQVSGFGDVPLSKAPFSAVTIDQKTLQDIGAQRVSDALRLDASVTDSYNSPAYWDNLSVRGYPLDNRYNYRREGLPISAETMIPMDNKERIELFKGTSGIQAGTSAPGGLVNYVVKRPPSARDETIRSVSIGYGGSKSSNIGLDLGGRFGQDQALGYRFNVAYEDLNPYIKNTEGHRKLFALAMDWRITPDSKLEWEIERSERQQFGVNGYSLLGDALPAPVDGKHNLTRQAWSVPGVFEGTTGTVRFKQNLEGGWLWTTQYGGQRLRTDDNLTFAWGSNLRAMGLSYPVDQDATLYDFRSLNEKRISDTLQTEVSGAVNLAGTIHNLSLGLQRSRLLDRLPPKQAWNYAGSLNTSSTPDPTPVYANANRSEYATELSVKDHMDLTTTTRFWLGLRHVIYDRRSEQNEPQGSNVSAIDGSAISPWLALSTQIDEKTLYVSHGYGLEQFVTPNASASFANPGEQLGVKKSSQTEVGIRQPSKAHGFEWSAAAFHISRPLAYDIFDANTWLSTRYLDGKQTHTGIDISMGWHNAVWTFNGQAQVVKARISKVALHPEIGTRPLNVPKYTLRGLVQYRFADIPGLRTSLRVNHEGSRRVTEDGSINLPSWTTLDFAAHYDTRIHGTRTQWTLAIDNVADRHYWREAPKQFGHYYLYPGAPRTFRVGLKTSF
jgi:iron complex outermembrane recepter protein